MKNAWAIHSAIDEAFESDFISLYSAQVPEMQYLLLPLFSHLCRYFRVVRMVILKMFFKTPTPMRDELDLIMVIPCLVPRWPIHPISGGVVPLFVCSKLRGFFLHIELCMKLGTFSNCHLPIVADSPSVWAHRYSCSWQSYEL